MTKDTVVRLANNTKYFILDECEEEEIKYFYAVRLDNHTDEPTNDYMLFEESISDGKTFIKKVINSDKIQSLLANFTANYIELAEELAEEASTSSNN